MVDHQAVASSNISSIGYDIEYHTLYVTFTSGLRYQYEGVPAEVYDDFLNAGSKGEFFADSIKGVYPYKRG